MITETLKVESIIPNALMKFVCKTESSVKQKQGTESMIIYVQTDFLY